ncbi:hypothetical protein ACFQ2M_06255 [Kitasatospora saccharophila]|uniref:hypothetical protein n=1 Tax=Kitasatospora saccharophila TaxID=407973 RepID=UPI00362D1EF2
MAAAGRRPPTLRLRRPPHRALLRALLGRPLPGLNVFVWIGPANPDLSPPVRVTVAAAAVLVLAQSLWSEFRTSVEFRAEELVVTNSVTRYTLRPEDVRKIGRGGISSGPPEFLRPGLEVYRADGRSIPVQVSLGLSRRGRTRLCDTMHDWARANRVDTDFRVLGPAGKWSD